MTFAEWRTFIANRIFKETFLLEWISATKWSAYPLLVRFLPRLAIAIHEPESTRAYWKALREGMIVIDGGANMGGYSILASRRVGGDGKVFAFEPEPKNAAKLRRRLRGYNNVVVVEKALSDTDGSAALHLAAFHAGHTLVGGDGPESVIRVPVITLDSFVREMSLPGLDFVKLDVEGVELQVLDGMTNVLRSSRRPTILCEVHPPILPEAFVSRLVPFRYRCTTLDAKLTGAEHAVPVHVLAVPQ
jgi:FkbM family methyltransferase